MKKGNPSSSNAPNFFKFKFSISDLLKHLFKQIDYDTCTYVETAIVLFHDKKKCHLSAKK